MAALLAGLAACGGSKPGPTAPTLSEPARAAGYVDSLLDIMEQNSVNRPSIDWANFKAQVHAAAPNPQSIPDVYPAISVALGALNDHHSFYIKSDGKSLILNPSSPSCVITHVPDPGVPTDVGYVRVASFDAPTGAQQFAEALQDNIRRQDKEGLAGWIVDLRGNGGGNMYPMVAGVGPILGDGVAGYFLAPSYVRAFGYRDGSSFLESFNQVTVSNKYVLRRANPRVAVLTDNNVASSGEATAVAFRGRPNTRTFGTPTCGVPSGNSQFVLEDSAQLYLTTSRDADRTRHEYDGPLPPDETISDSNALVARAIAWLRSGA
jgi:hypothetical protein